MPVIRSASTPTSGSRRCRTTSRTARSANSCRRPRWCGRIGSISIRKSGRRTQTELIRAAAEDAAVERIFVNAAIKKALCREAGLGSRMAAESAALVGPRLSFPRPHRLSGRQPALQAAAAAGSRRRLRSRARLLVQGIDPASGAAAHSAEAEAAADAGRIAGRRAKDRGGAVISAVTRDGREKCRPMTVSKPRRAENGRCASAAVQHAGAEMTITAVKCGDSTFGHFGQSRQPEPKTDTRRKRRRARGSASPAAAEKFRRARPA